MEVPCVIESNVSLSYAERLRAEMAIALGRGAGALLMLVPAAAGILVLASPGLSPSWLGLPIGLFLIAFVPARLLLFAYRGLKLAERNGPYSYRISPEGFELKSRTAELKQAWPGIPRVNISHGFILIYANKRSAYPLPLRLVSGQEAQAVLAMASAGGVARVGA
jgi:hypothetical protein